MCFTAKMPPATASGSIASSLVAPVHGSTSTGGPGSSLSNAGSTCSAPCALDRAEGRLVPRMSVLGSRDGGEIDTSASQPQRTSAGATCRGRPHRAAPNNSSAPRTKHTQSTKGNNEYANARRLYQYGERATARHGACRRAAHDIGAPNNNVLVFLAVFLRVRGRRIARQTLCNALIRHK